MNRKLKRSQEILNKLIKEYLASQKYVSDYYNEQKNLIIRFFEYYRAYFADLSQIFLGIEFYKAVEQEKIEEFFKEEKNIINSASSPIKRLLQSYDLDSDKSPYPVLYWIFEPLCYLIENLSDDEDKNKSKRVIWSAFNFWDSFLKQPYAVQFLNPSYFDKINKDNEFFYKIVRNWMLKPVAKNNILTLTDLLFAEKVPRKIIVIQNDRIPNFRQLHGKVEQIYLEGYSNLIENLSVQKDKIKEKILKNDSEIDEILINYLNSINIKEKEQVSKNFEKPLHNINIKKNSEELIKVINLFLIFDLITPGGWQFIMIYPPLLSVDTAVGGAFFVSRRTLGFPMALFLQQTLTEVFGNIESVIYRVRFLKEALKSAIAAIMSRNGSHNIGSHIISAVSNSYNDLPDDQILFEYIQQRMDFVATISTEFPEWTYPVWFIGDLMRRFYMQRHLLSYIGQSEGLSAYEFRTKLTNVNKMPSNNQTGKIFVKINRKGFSEFIIPNENKNVSELKDFQVAIPGGIIGQQAFYTILENIIRNSAKHNWSSLSDSEKKERENLEITIEIDENKKRQDIIFRIWDNASDVFKGTSTDQKKYQASQPIPDEVQLENKNIEAFPLHQQINKKLGESFIDKESGKLVKANWGLAEMKISAGFLNMKSVAKIGSDDVDEILYNAKKSTGIIRAIRKRERREGKEDIWHLGYEFAIKKPKEFLIIDYSIPGDIESYLENSINFYREKNLKSHDYEFVIIYDDINNENDFIVELIKNIDNLNGEIEKYPFRLFLVTNRAYIFEKSQFLQKRICFLKPKIFIEKIKEPKQFKIWVYTEWVKHLKTITGNANKSINMLINIFGERSHSQDASLVKLLFENYKERIIEKNLGHEIDNEIKNALKSVIVKDFDEERKPYKDVENLISEWISNSEKYIKKSIDDCTFEKLEERLKDKAEDYYYLLKNIYTKYEEDIETLPQEYVVKQSENRKTLKWKINEETRDELKLFLTDTGKDKRIKTEDKDNKIIIFSYNRHSKLKPRNDLKYNEALSGAQFYFSLLLNNQRDNYLKEKIILQLIENSLLRILIIDERVSNYQEKHAVEGTFEHIGISVPYQIKGDQIFDLTDQKVDLTNIPNNKYDALIIHQGMLDKIIKNKSEKLIDDFIKELKKAIPFVLVTSGRGEPDNIPENAKFLAFSNIESFILKEYPEKFFLTQMLMKVVSREGKNND